MKNWKIAVSIATVVIIVLTASCMGATDDENPQISVLETVEPTRRIVDIHLSYPVSYDSIEQLVDDSDLIAYVEIGDAYKTSIIDTVYLTHYEATILESFYGDEKNITITMTGADTDSVLCEIGIDPLPSAGDQYIIFASKNEDGSYLILGGSQGRFVYDEENDIVTSLHENIIMEKYTVDEAFIESKYSSTWDDFVMEVEKQLDVNG